jgi:hypothetical protein
MLFEVQRPEAEPHHDTQDHFWHRHEITICRYSNAIRNEYAHTTGKAKEMNGKDTL